MQLFGDRTKLPREEQVAFCNRSFELAILARVCLLTSFLYFVYGQYWLFLNDAIPLPQDRLTMVVGIAAIVWFFAGVAFLTFVLINKMFYSLPRNLVVAIFIEEAIRIRNDSSRFLRQDEQILLGKTLWRLGVTLAFFMSNRRMHRTEKKAISNLNRRYPYIKELILIKDRGIFALLEPHLQNIALDFRSNSMPKFVEDYERLQWTLERLPDYWEIRSNYPIVRLVVGLGKVLNFMNQALEKMFVIMKTKQGVGFFMALVITSIIQHFFPR